MEVPFWVCVFGLFYTFSGYSVLIGWLAKFFPRPPAPLRKNPLSLRATVVLAVYNGLPQILARLENLLSQDYPLLDIIVVSDGSDDGTDAAVAAVAGNRVRIISSSKRMGKSACLNLGVQEATGDIIVFADVRQRYAADTVSRLIGGFSDEQVGAVSGALEIEPSHNSIAKGIGTYWNIEKRLRHIESLWDSCIGCTGAVYAIRRDLFQEIPGNTLLDDVVIPMQIAMSGYRVIFNPQAIAYDPQSLDPERERVRKRRTLAGNFQMLFRYPGWMLPWRNRLWFQLVSHKYLRLLGPFLLLGAFACNLFLLDQRFYRLLFIGQIAFYIAAILGSCDFIKRPRFLSYITSFVFLNLMVLRGLADYLLGENDGTWEGTMGTDKPSVNLK